jgi:prepilin-type N-terminal cleavage/methylation domain-containing protein
VCGAPVALLLGVTRITHHPPGFTLVEVLVASTLVVSALAGFAHLIALAVARSHAVRDAGAAQALAQGKLEELRGVPWTYDAAGAPVSDPALAESPANTLAVDVGGWSDALDAAGEAVAATDGHHAVYRRRWSIGRFNAIDADTLVLRVCVHALVSASAPGRGLPDACVSTVRTRKP